MFFVSTIVGAIVDFLLAIFKVIAGVVGNSGALIADGPSLRWQQFQIVHDHKDVLRQPLQQSDCRHFW
jgi:hypothetical protein